MRWFLCLAVVLIVSGANAQEFYVMDSTELIKAQKLKMLVVTAQDLNDEQSTPDTVFRQQFDSEGRSTEIALWDEDFTEWNLYRYDDAGNQTGRYEMNGPGDTLFLHESTFEDDRLIELRSFPVSRNLLKTETFEYDGEGRLLRHKISNTEGIVYYRKTMSYDNNGFPLRTMIEDLANGGEMLVSTYKHDDAGNELEAIYNNPNGESIVRSTYTKDGQLATKTLVAHGEELQVEKRTYIGDKLTKTELIESDGETVSETKLYRYDSKGHKIAYERQSGDVTSKFTYNFDKSGNLIEEVYERSDGKRAIFQRRTFDRNGNLLSEKQSTNGKPQWSVNYTYHKSGLCESKEEVNEQLGSKHRYQYLYTKY